MARAPEKCVAHHVNRNVLRSKTVKKYKTTANVRHHYLILDYNPYDLSYSTRKFVTVASIVAMDQDILILDEPTAGQDYIGMKHLSNLISTLKNEGKTVITITHDMEFVVDNFERVIVMASKRLLADGEKRDIFWNSEVLDKASLKQPHISRLSSTLELQKKILTISEIVTYLKEKM